MSPFTPAGSVDVLLRKKLMIKEKTHESSLSAGASIMRDEASEPESDPKVLMRFGYVAH